METIRREDELSKYFRERGWKIDTQEISETADKIKKYFRDEDTRKIHGTGIYAVRDYLSYLANELDTEQKHQINQIKSLVRKSDFNISEYSESKVDRVKKNVLTKQEIESALDTATEYEELVVRMLYDSACRAGEIAALKGKIFTFGWIIMMGTR